MHEKLDDIMEIGHVIHVSEFGVITIPENVYAPEVYISMDADGQISGDDDNEMIRMVEVQGWHVVNGYSGQYSYSGPIMHTSEYVGGDLEKCIRETPGFWVACEVETLNIEAAGSDAIGWVILHKEA